MSETYAAFLRGINVNGKKIPMENLRSVFSSFGCHNVHTILNTGNVLFSTDQTRQNIAADAESSLMAAFGYQSPVFLRSGAELNYLKNQASLQSVPENCHLYLLLCDHYSTVMELKQLFSEISHVPSESFQPAGPESSDAFWMVPKGQTLSSAFGSKVLGARKYRDLLTSRNINTLDRILAQMS